MRGSAESNSEVDLADDNLDAEEEMQEPLALLVVHAVMHMMFLSQFTCDFYEEETSPSELYASSSDSEPNQSDYDSKSRGEA